MEVKACFDHFNINVTDLQRSIDFYDKALGLRPCGKIEGPEGAFVIVYLADAETGFRLELTWLKDHPQPYDLGECEFHLCVRVPGDFLRCMDMKEETTVRELTKEYYINLNVAKKAFDIL
ncbi:MAG: VOC family protein [Bacteroidaceae bacterium]|nr:VOC family protein [Bacteroidaceae bacterium]